MPAVAGEHVPLRIPAASGARTEFLAEALPANRLALLTTVAVAVSFALVFLPSPQSDPFFIALAAVVGGILIGASFALHRYPRWTRLAVPIGYLLMTALLRQAEGGASSGFSGLFLVAVTFLALSGNRLDLAAGLVGMLLAQLLPIVVWGAPSYPSSGYRGVIVLTTATAITGLTIQQLLSDLSKRVERDVLRRVVEAQEVERRRLARELHDEAGQTLTSMLIGLKRLEEKADPATREVVHSLRESVVGTLRGLRRIVVELRPKALDDLGLVPALEALAASITGSANLSIEFQAEDFPRLRAEVETALYRIVQEGLTNVVRHAQASIAYVRIASGAGWVLLSIEDDGRGVGAAHMQNGGFGLEGIRERVQLLGGRFLVTSTEGNGTSLLVEVPAS